MVHRSCRRTGSVRPCRLQILGGAHRVAGRAECFGDGGEVRVTQPGADLPAVVKALLIEQQHLLPLASEGMDLARTSFPTVNSMGCVKF